MRGREYLAVGIQDGARFAIGYRDCALPSGSVRFLLLQHQYSQLRIRPDGTHRFEPVRDGISQLERGGLRSDKLGQRNSKWCGTVAANARIGEQLRRGSQHVLLVWCEPIDVRTKNIKKCPP